MQPEKRLAILLSFSGAGGVERMILNLLTPILESDVGVDLLAILRKPCTELVRIDGSGLRVLDLGVTHTGLAVPAIVRYLKAERPAAFLAVKDRAIRAAVLGRRLSGVETRLVGRLGTNLSAALERKPAPIRWARRWPMRLLYPSVDCVVAVSEGVAEDTRRITGLPAEKIVVVRNPVITRDMQEKSRAPVDHPWFAQPADPIILGAGRLTRQKDFATLIRAFSQVRAVKPCRLVILGEGGLRADLERLAARLDLAEAVSLPGRTTNPYAHMARSALFVLSSAWEGSPNVLAEALALGVPSVSTDCPSGPREILADGRYGPLVPVGDADALAAAMLRTLESPLPGERLRAAVADYTAERSAQSYLAILGLAAAQGA